MSAPIVNNDEIAFILELYTECGDKPNFWVATGEALDRTAKQLWDAVQYAKKNGMHKREERRAA